MDGDTQNAPQLRYHTHTSSIMWYHTRTCMNGKWHETCTQQREKQTHTFTTDARLLEHTNKFLTSISSDLHILLPWRCTCFEQQQVSSSILTCMLPMQLPAQNFMKYSHFLVEHMTSYTLIFSWKVNRLNSGSKAWSASTRLDDNLMAWRNSSACTNTMANFVQRQVFGNLQFPWKSLQKQTTSTKHAIQQDPERSHLLSVHGCIGFPVPELELGAWLDCQNKTELRAYLKLSMQPSL